LWLEPVKAVAIIDRLLGSQLVTARDLNHLVGERLGLHGARRVKRTFGFTDGGAQSPAESILRVRLLQRGFPRPCTQFAVHVNGKVLHPRPRMAGVYGRGRIRRPLAQWSSAISPGQAAPEPPERCRMDCCACNKPADALRLHGPGWANSKLYSNGADGRATCTPSA